MPPSSTLWTQDKVAELERLWPLGYSARDIAHELGAAFTRCAVLGKINRLGLERRKPPQPRKPEREVIARGKPIRRRPVFIAPPPEPPPPPPPDLSGPRPRRLQLMQLLEHHCRWPIGDPRGHPFYFCAADRKPGAVYCPYHMRKAWR